MTSIAEKYAAQFMPNGEASLADLIQAAVDEDRRDIARHLEHLQERIRQLEQEVNAHRENEGTFADELQSVSSVPAGQSVPVVGDAVVAITGEPIAILRREIGEDTWFDWTPVLPNSKTHKQLKAAGEMDYCEVYQRYTQSIPAAELATLREKAAMADELLKDAERYQWLRMKGAHSDAVDKVHMFGPQLDTAIDAAIAQGKGE